MQDEQARLRDRVADMEGTVDVLSAGRRADYAALRALAATARDVTLERDGLSGEKQHLQATVTSLTDQVAHMRQSRLTQDDSLSTLSTQFSIGPRRARASRDGSWCLGVTGLRSGVSHRRAKTFRRSAARRPCNDRGRPAAH